MSQQLGLPPEPLGLLLVNQQADAHARLCSFLSFILMAETPIGMRQQKITLCRERGGRTPMKKYFSRIELRNLIEGRHKKSGFAAFFAFRYKVPANAVRPLS